MKSVKELFERQSALFEKVEREGRKSATHPSGEEASRQTESRFEHGGNSRSGGRWFANTNIQRALSIPQNVWNRRLRDEAGFRDL